MLTVIARKMIARNPKIRHSSTKERINNMGNYSFRERLFGALPAIIIAVIVVLFTTAITYVGNFCWDFTYGATYWVLGLYIASAVMVILSFIFADFDTGVIIGVMSIVGYVVLCALLMAIFGLANGAINHADDYFAIASEHVVVYEGDDQNIFPDLIGRE